MAKRKPNRRYTVVEHIDRAVAEAAFENLKISIDKRNAAFLRLTDIISIVRKLERSKDPSLGQPIGAAKKQRKAFLNLAKKLESVATEINDLDKYREHAPIVDGLKIYIPKQGEIPFRRAVGRQLSEVLNPGFINSFGIQVEHEAESAETMRRNLHVERTEVDLEYLGAEIKKNAAPISSTILRKIAAGIREAEQALAKATPKGGRLADPIRNIVLLNIIAFWYENISTKGLYYNSKRGPFTRFVREMCQLLGASGFFSETYVKAAIVNFKERVGR